jgi:hypothetical protein
LAGVAAVAKPAINASKISITTTRFA